MAPAQAELGTNALVIHRAAGFLHYSQFIEMYRTLNKKYIVLIFAVVALKYKNDISVKAIVFFHRYSTLDRY